MSDLLEEIQEKIQVLPETAVATIRITRSGTPTLRIRYTRGKRRRPNEYGLQENVTDVTVLQATDSLVKCLLFDLNAAREAGETSA